jgi:CDP-diacylglycerol--serine O-phosphatidyltransferase
MNISSIKRSDDKGENPGTGAQVRITRLIPNLLTLLALAAGLTAIQYSLDNYWGYAVIAIVIAATLDALDGAMARLLKATSEFGAQLDSLSDFLAFGVAPAFILHTWVLEDAGKLGWIAFLVFPAASALRLARFNVTQAAKPAAWKKGFFSGVPAPAGAGLALLPLIIWLQFDPAFFRDYAVANVLIGLWVIFVGALMVSRIPTWSTKQIKLPAKMAMPMLAFAVVVIASLIHAPWQTLTVMGVCYLAHIPFAVRHFRKLQHQHEDHEDLTDLALGADDLDTLSPSLSEDKSDA